MRGLLASLVIVLLPLSALAASINDFNGKWLVDLATTMKNNPEMKPDEEMRKLTLTIDAGAKTIGMDYGRETAVKQFTVVEESPAGVTIKRADNRLLRLIRHGREQLAIGEVRGQKLQRVMYFIRQKK